MTEKSAVQKTEVLELDYRLAELPSSQHRSGLAGLVLMVKWLERLGTNKGICEFTRLDAKGVALRINEIGLESLFDEVYAASVEEQERSQPLKNKKKEIIPPLREEVRQETDPETGKVKSKAVYIYPVTVPKGALLADLDPTAEGGQGAWIKLWRDMIWSILRGVPATREPFESRAEGKRSNDVTKVWKDLCQPQDYRIDLPSTYFIGAQAANAEDVPFKDRARYQFLLHFWPYVAQIYVPAVINNEGSREFVGYALAIPDIADLELFCEELQRILKHNRGIELSGYRPRDSVVDLAVEGALDLLSRLRERLTALEGARATSDLVLGVDVLHVVKEGNNIRILGTSRIDPEDQMIDQYQTLRGSLRNPTFRRQRLLNLVKQRVWHADFDGILSTLPYEQSIGSKSFRHDAKESFENEIRLINEEVNTPMTAASGDINEFEVSTQSSCEELVYKLVGTYLSRKLKSKYQLEWASVKDDPSKKEEFNKMREKTAKDAFLAIRSRTGLDFIDYFASTLCSLPQRLSEKEFELLAQALYQETDKVRTLTMLALSARS